MRGPGDQHSAQREAVRFDDHGDSTGVEVSLNYDPPGGALGEAAPMLSLCT